MFKSRCFCKKYYFLSKEYRLKDNFIPAIIYLRTFVPVLFKNQSGLQGEEDFAKWKIREAASLSI